MTAVPVQDDDADEAGPLRERGEDRTRLTEHSAQADLRTVLQLCAAGKLRCSEKTMRPSAATVGTIAGHLSLGDFYVDEPIASFAWPLLVQAGGLARIEQGRLQLTPKGRAALKKPSADVIKSLWQRWLRHAPIDEFNRIEAIKGQRSKNVLSAATRRRQTVATAIAQLPQDEWIDTDDLFDSMQLSGLSPTIARNQMSMWKLYLVDQQYGSLGYDGYHQWEMVEGRYTLAVLFEYAGTLGLLDLGYVHPDGARDDFRDNWGSDFLTALSRYDGLEAIRVNALGAYALGITDSYSPSADHDEARVLKILPNLDIVATGALSASDALVLSAYAVQTADRVWTLSSASLLAALHTGRDLTEFTTFLTRRAENEPPPTLAHLVADVTRRSAQLTNLGTVALIECADPALAALIANDRKLRGLCRQVGDRHVAVPLENELKFGKLLQKLGYVLPASEIDSAPFHAASRSTNF